MADKTPASTDTGFKFDMGLPVPPMSRSPAKSEMAAKLKAMPVGASFLEAVTVPASVQGDEEREKTFKELARTVSNRVSGAIRRFKTSNSGYEFAARTVNDKANGAGVRVWRIAVEETAKPATAPSA